MEADSPSGMARMAGMGQASRGGYLEEAERTDLRRDEIQDGQRLLI